MFYPLVIFIYGIFRKYGSAFWKLAVPGAIGLFIVDAFGRASWEPELLRTSAGVVFLILSLTLIYKAEKAGKAQKQAKIVEKTEKLRKEAA